MGIVHVLALAVDVDLINRDDAHERAEIFVGKTGADAAAHIQSRFVRADIHLPMDLLRTDAVLADQHPVNDAKPVAKRLVRVLKDRARDGTEAIVGVGWRTLMAQPAILQPWMWLDRLGAAARAAHTEGPAVPDDIVSAILLSFEEARPFQEGHLLDALRDVPGDHIPSSIDEENRLGIISGSPKRRPRRTGSCKGR